MNLDAKYRVTGVSISRTADYLRNSLPPAAAEGARSLQLSRTPNAEEIDVVDDYVGRGYGEMTKACAEAIAITARTEGVLLDPVYSGKAMAGLIGAIRSGEIKRDESVIFLNTGGWPALFAYDSREFVSANG
jgi:D-cysteine desulfhydrase/L-cysteate sulfo-lyase